MRPPRCSATTCGSSCRKALSERLNTTEYTQPAMLAAGIATRTALGASAAAANPAVVAGHSLGEFTALVCAGALELLDCRRARAVPRPGDAGSGAGRHRCHGRRSWALEDADVEAACREAAQGGVVEAVNFNSAGQVVIAGETAAVQRADRSRQGKGGRSARCRCR